MIYAYPRGEMKSKSTPVSFADGKLWLSRLRAALGTGPHVHHAVSLRLVVAKRHKPSLYVCAQEPRRRGETNVKGVCDGEHAHARVCVYVCVCVRACARVRMRVWWWWW